MNYIEQINGFWAKAETAEITGNDIAVYMALLKYCNNLNWLNPFICHWEIICQYSKVSKNTYYKSLETLSENKFIEYKKGERNKFSAKIFILKFENNKGTIKEQQGNNKGTEREQLEEQQGNLYKLINNETIKPINNKNKYPSLDEFLAYGKEKKPLVCIKALTLKFHAWSENDWHKESGGKRVKINNWKTTLLNTLPYIQEAEPEQPKFQRLY